MIHIYAHGHALIKKRRNKTTKRSIPTKVIQFKFPNQKISKSLSQILSLDDFRSNKRSDVIRTVVDSPRHGFSSDVQLLLHPSLVSYKCSGKHKQPNNSGMQLGIFYSKKHLLRACIEKYD